jgi:hypothetical protein
MAKTASPMNLFEEVQKLIMTDKNAQALAKIMNSPLKEIMDVNAKLTEEFLSTIVANIHNADELKKAIQLFAAQNMFVPVYVIKTLFKFNK